MSIKNNAQAITITNFKLYYRTIVTKDVGIKQTCRPMEESRGLRNKAKLL
jgi:hypothetical protein